MGCIFLNINQTVLEVNNLVIRFDVPEGVVHAVNGVTLNLKEGETLGIVGESGCGKSVTMLSILRLIQTPPGRIASGRIQFQENDLLQISLDKMRTIRGAKIGMIFQDPMTSLNPVLTIGRQLTESLEIHLGFNKNESKNRAIELLSKVGIPAAKDRLKDYPHQFSGGMRQRVMIAMALTCSPKILIADEPTTALDVTIQAQIVSLVKKLGKEFGMAIIWITHDLAVIAGLADRVMVMYAGYVVEEAPVKELYKNPQHPYTIGLMNSLPRIDLDLNRLINIQGSPPDMLIQNPGCPFIERCPNAFDRCKNENPSLQKINDKHHVACWWDVNKKIKRDE